MTQDDSSSSVAQKHQEAGHPWAYTGCCISQSFSPSCSVFSPGAKITLPMPCTCSGCRMWRAALLALPHGTTVECRAYSAFHQTYTISVWNKTAEPQLQSPDDTPPTLSPFASQIYLTAASTPRSFFLGGMWKYSNYNFVVTHKWEAAVSLNEMKYTEMLHSHRHLEIFFRLIANIFVDK